MLKTPVNHSPGREVVEAHPIRVAPGSHLARLTEARNGSVRTGAGAAPTETQHVNSSHHQAIGSVGDNLRVVAVSPEDGVVEAVELDSPDHFVLAVQWHPERTYTQSALSRAIFAAFVQAAAQWQPRQISESVAAK